MLVDARMAQASALAEEAIKRIANPYATDQSIRGSAPDG